MATLVLTTVGGAIGGPIGAALGAMLGQQVDRAVLLQPAGRQGPRLTELAVQTSSYGTRIPQVFGTMRVAGSVIWSTDLIESRSTAGGGKGQPSVTSYSYAASFAVALSTRPIVRVGRIWADGKLLRGAAGDWKTESGFRLHTGSETQEPDPLIASAVSAAPAHRGLAYAVFENLQLADFGNRIPSLTFEVVADEAAPAIGAIARALGGVAIVGAGPVDTIDGFAAGGDSVGGALAVLARAAGAIFVPAGAAMRLTAEVTMPVVSLPGDMRWRETRAAADRDAAVLRISHYDPARDWQVGVQQARGRGGGWRETAIELPAALSAGRARALAEAELVRQAAARRKRSLTLGHEAIGTMPGAALLFPDDPARWRVTAVAIGSEGVTLEATPVVEGAADLAADAGTMLPTPDLVSGRTRLELVELPPFDDRLTTVPAVAAVAAGEGDGWRSAALLLSRDNGMSWEEAGGTAMPAVLGRLEAPLPRAPETLVDCVGTIEVMLSHDLAALSPANAAALDRGANLALIGDELIQFAAAQQVAPRRWRLRALWRGRRGTPPAAHSAGTRFVLIDSPALRWLTLPDLRPGDSLRVRAAGVGDGGVATEAVTVVSGIAVAPLSPVRLRVTATGDNGERLDWTRRSRLGWRWVDGLDVPLVEEREAYRVQTAMRTVEVDTPTILLLPGERAAGPVSVAQIGTLALSAPASLAG